MDVAISVVVGGLITILTAIGIEYLRTPRLQLRIEVPPCDMAYGEAGNRPARDVRYLRLKLRNRPLPLGVRWMQRSAALQCRGRITFHHLDGQDVFGRAMEVRWAGSPQPIASQILDPDTQEVCFVIQDFARIADSRVDVYPGEEELLDVAARLDNEADCYGWNNESYLYAWRTPRWKLQPGRYLVKVVVSSSGQQCVGIVRLVNDVQSRSDFRLLEATAEDRAKLSVA